MRLIYIVNSQILGDSDLDLDHLKRRNSCTRNTYVNFGKRFKKNFYCYVNEVISQRKWSSTYEWINVDKFSGYYDVII